ncbi:LamG-like jellyroll fold domain-containing protein [Streptomyces sp. MA15]|uniref:LamG-like jellyroll fold domain-containing protein n=1 Tax=Streptomyces sp. MA15 TaxID=3055061 RepID=UPI0025B04AD4|nr:LamG-like jellyroll fold domain-containing protein [Streptomyces sp. MA15]MDN3268117.1 hypothetical protein [Streptomyces sp. MA15]
MRGHLTGVCDSVAGELRLFVNGVQEGAVRDRILIVSEGPFVIGRGRYGGRPVDHFPGGIKDVMVFDRALTGGLLGEQGATTADGAPPRAVGPWPILRSATGQAVS